MKLNTYIFPSSIICFCFLKLMCLCSWQWFLCTFLCLLVAVNQGVLKTGHTVEASRETWCGEVVTWSRSLSSYFVGGFHRSSQKPAGQDFECCRQNLMVGSEENRKPEWFIGILKLNRGPWLFRWKLGLFRDLEQRPKPFYSGQEVVCAVKLYWDIKRRSANDSEGGNFMAAWYSHRGMSGGAYFCLRKP